MTDFIVVSSALQLYVPDTWVKGGAEQSTDHHLVVSKIRWQGRKLDRPRKPKQVVQVNSEHLVKEPVRWVFSHHLWKCFSHVLGDVRDNGSEWTMFKASIV